ncbi:hypothetical protein Pgy4_29150, partial [Pseudomonas savastanoi pv. glycinea str. race 4]
MGVMRSDHRVGEADVVFDPVMQVGIAQGGKCQQRLASDCAIVRQVIAGHQGKGWRTFGTAACSGCA